MDNVKIILTVYTEGEASKSWSKKGKNNNPKATNVVCSQRICLSHEAYKSMLAYPCKGYHKSSWKALSKGMKIGKHLEQYALSLGSSKFDYVILED